MKNTNKYCQALNSSNSKYLSLNLGRSAQSQIVYSVKKTLFHSSWILHTSEKNGLTIRRISLDYIWNQNITVLFCKEQHNLSPVRLNIHAHFISNQEKQKVETICRWYTINIFSLRVKAQTSSCCGGFVLLDQSELKQQHSRPRSPASPGRSVQKWTVNESRIVDYLPLHPLLSPTWLHEGAANLGASPVFNPHQENTIWRSKCEFTKLNLVKHTTQLLDTWWGLEGPSGWCCATFKIDSTVSQFLWKQAQVSVEGKG